MLKPVTDIPPLKVQHDEMARKKIPKSIIKFVYLNDLKIEMNFRYIFGQAVNLNKTMVFQMPYIIQFKLSFKGILQSATTAADYAA